MTVSIIIILYILNVFITRWLNKICYQSNPQKTKILPLSWFIPGSNILWIIEYLFIKSQNKTWFTGRYW